MGLFSGFMGRKSFMIGLDVGFDSIKVAGIRESSGKSMVESIGYARLDSSESREEEARNG